MPSSISVSQLSNEILAVEFFRLSAGNWRSQRRYYTLSNEETQEVVSNITVKFLEPGDAMLMELAKLHHLEADKSFVGGSLVTWESNYTQANRKPSTGKTVFGILGDILYRDRGFATADPVTAQFFFTNSRTMCLRTEYKGSVFEEELKLIGDLYRTRQTIISRAGQEVMIGQYLEKRSD
jgi:hypothetical protein